MSAGPRGTSGQRKRRAADLDCATAFQMIALDCVAGIEAQHAGACAGDVEAVHQIRVAITRLRAAVAFFAPVVVDAEWLRLKQEIAWLNGPLGAARDSDVLAEYADRKRYRAWAEHVVGKQFHRRRTGEHRRLVQCLRSVRMQRLVAALAGWIRHGKWLKQFRRRKHAEALQPYCERQLGRWHERLIRKGKRLKTLSASRRHRLRIRAKRFRYMLEALTEPIALRDRGGWHRLHRPAKRLQRALGDHRDLERFAGLAGDAPAARGAGHGSKPPPGYARQMEKLLDAAAAAHRELKHP